MNIRDYLFIRKAKSSNKIKILDVLGFEADTTIIQTPDIIKEMDNLRITNEFEMVDEEIESIEIGRELVTTKENIFETPEIEESNPDTQTFVPLNITSQIKKIWTDLEMRRQWVVPTLLVVATVSIISFVSVFFINMRNNDIQNETIAVSITENTNNNISQITQLLDVATNPFYSRYDVSNASANLQIIETSLLQYQENLENRDISDSETVFASLNLLFDVVDKLDQLFTYRIMHSEILIYDDILQNFGLELPIKEWFEEDGIDDESIADLVSDEVDKMMAEKSVAFGTQSMRQIEKQVLLQTIDTKWREHLITLEHLRSVVGFRGYAQRDPLNEYKSEAFQLFEVLLNGLRSDVSKQLSKVRPLTKEEQMAMMKQVASQQNQAKNQIDARSKDSKGLSFNENDRSTWGNIGRNEPCPCGSGKKFKHCHGRL